MLTIKSIPAFNDNYIWLIQNHDLRCAVVDPGDAQPVIDYLDRHGLTLEAILVTHHHNDHTGGISALINAYPQLKVVGPQNNAIASLTHQMKGGDQFSLFDETFLVLDLPGHTLDHIGYVGDGKLFCGDVLFSAGCGRVFEGSYQQMFDSLNKILRLPEETEIFPAHEYTSSNIAFAMAVEPDNKALLEYREDVYRLRDENRPTLPTTLRQEKWINPFLRYDQPSIIKSVSNRISEATPLSVFSALREWKNAF